METTMDRIEELGRRRKHVLEWTKTGDPALFGSLSISPDDIEFCRDAISPETRGALIAKIESHIGKIERLYGDELIKWPRHATNYEIMRYRKVIAALQS
jgi:hypothetical protein